MRRFNQHSALIFGIGVSILLLIAALLTPHAAAAADKPQRWALLIGVNDYASVQHLRYCVADRRRWPPS